MTRAGGRTVQMGLNALGCARQRLQLVVRRIGGHVQAIADAPVHLDDDLDGLLLEQRRVGDGPGVLPEPLVPQPLRELLGDMRRIGLDHAHRGLGGETGRRVVR